MKKYLLIIILLLTINVKAETITFSSNTKLSDKVVEDSREESNVIIVNNGDLVLDNCTINKNGNGIDDTAASYNNTAVLINEKSKIDCNKSNINTIGDYAHGLYFKDKASGTISNTNIKTSNKYSVGIINDGATIKVSNTSIETSEHDSSGVYAVGGTIEVSNSNITTKGVDSPLFKVASKIIVSDTKLIANNSESIIGIPGADITLNNVEIYSNNIMAEEANYKNIYLYNPGDFEGNIIFNAKNSKIDTNIGNTFNIVNADVIINLDNNEINNTNGIFLKAYESKYEDTNNNIELNLYNQLIKGNTELNSDTKINIYLESSEYIGAINSNNQAKEVNITLTKDSKLTLTSNIHVNSLTNGDYDNNNINLNGYKLYINNEELSKDNIKRLNEKNDTLYIIIGFIIGLFLGYSVIYLYKMVKNHKRR